MKILGLGLLMISLLSPCAQAGISVVGDLSQEKTALPGEVYQGEIVIRNSSSEPQEAKIYQTDYQFFADGTNSYADPGQTPRSNAGWITFSPKRIIVPPQGMTRVHYQVQVPSDKHYEGSYWSMLMVEGITMMDGAGGRTSLGLQTILRYGVQIVTEIGETGTSALKFVDPRLFQDAEGIFMQVDVEDTGTRWLRPNLWLELYDGQAGLVGKFMGTKMRLYPGTSVRHKIKLGDIPKGRYKVLLVADCGGANVFGGVYILKLE